jgi:hypothetical protein
MTPGMFLDDTDKPYALVRRVGRHRQQGVHRGSHVKTTPIVTVGSVLREIVATAGLGMVRVAR